MALIYLTHALFGQKHNNKIHLEGEYPPQEFVECPITSEIYEFLEYYYIDDCGTIIATLPELECPICRKCQFYNLTKQKLIPNYQRKYIVYVKCESCDNKTELHETIECSEEEMITFYKWNYNCVCGNKENGQLKISIITEPNAKNRGIYRNGRNTSDTCPF